jgi:hypothetical protein
MITRRTILKTAVPAAPAGLRCAGLGPGGLTAWERGRREGGARVRRALMSTTRFIRDCWARRGGSDVGSTSLL